MDEKYKLQYRVYHLPMSMYKNNNDHNIGGDHDEDFGQIQGPVGGWYCIENYIG